MGVCSSELEREEWASAKPGRTDLVSLQQVSTVFFTIFSVNNRRSFADGESSLGPTVEGCNLFLKTFKSLKER